MTRSRTHREYLRIYTGPEVPLCELPADVQQRIRDELALAHETGIPPRKWFNAGFEGDPHPLARWLRRAWVIWNRERTAMRKQVRRQRIIDRDGMMCGICRTEIARLDDLHIDHIIPLARGGSSHPSNLQPAHAICNMRKGAN